MSRNPTVTNQDQVLLWTRIWFVVLTKLFNWIRNWFANEFCQLILNHCFLKVSVAHCAVSTGCSWLNNKTALLNKVFNGFVFTDSPDDCIFVVFVSFKCCFVVYCILVLLLCWQVFEYLTVPLLSIRAVKLKSPFIWPLFRCLNSCRVVSSHTSSRQSLVLR